MTAQVILNIFDFLFPVKLQEAIPLLEVNRTFIFALSRLMTDPVRIEAEETISQLVDISTKVEDIGESFALRKGVGQTIDNALSAVALSAGLIAYFSQSQFGDFGPVLIYIFSSTSMVLATLAGIFGPPYFVFKDAKERCLKFGNYRGAVLFNTLESLMAIPFYGGAAGFLVLDLPPVDQPSLEEFKLEISEQLDEISDRIVNLLGTGESRIPDRAKRLINEILDESQESLNKIDFRNIREEKAREFALQIYQNEFTLKFWKRKKALEEFANRYHLTLEEAKYNLMNLSFKILAGQEDEDLINNLMVTAVLKIIIQEEQKYSELVDDLELGKISTGLAFGVRQFMKDHYAFQSKWKNRKSRILNFFYGLFVLPYILINAYYQYALISYKFLVMKFVNLKNRPVVEYSKMRYTEIGIQLDRTFDRLIEIKNTPKQFDDLSSKLWNGTKRGSKILIKAVLEFLVLPFKILYKILIFPLSLFRESEIPTRTKFEQEISQLTLVEIYDELFKRLMMSDHISTAY